MEEIFQVWYLIGAALVFFMQAGFAMVETGFTRAKNAGNIIMKNLMDFCLGTVAFLILGFGLMMGEATATAGIIGIPTLGWLTNPDTFDWSSFVFNLVFCATAATIVSGAMAERTKFSSYCIYSFVISMVIYPIEACWIWNPNGWLVTLGFHDFAGSCAIHMVGGIAALLGAIFLGPRLGKYTKGKDGKTKVNAIPGHSLTLGALGCFILWFGWYGFNGAAATSVQSLAIIFANTTIAAAAASCSTMFFTWIKNGKPDVSMTLNGSLAGLVAITAGCDVVPAWAALLIGLIAGILVVLVVELLDKKLHIDDPVGAVGVHCANGIWGTFAVGLFAEDGGLFLGGGAYLLGIQVLGIVSVAAWTLVTMLLTYTLIKKTNGLRVSREEEMEGLDKMEHGMPSAYADFTSVSLASEIIAEGEPEGFGVDLANTQVAPIKTSSNDSKMYKVVIITKQAKLEVLTKSLEEIGISGMTVTQVLGCGIQKGASESYRGVKMDMDLLPKVKVEIVVSKVPVETVVETARKVLYTGHIGDGKIFVYDVQDVVKVRTGVSGYDALQDEI